jgi:hypothetical protein
MDASADGRSVHVYTYSNESSTFAVMAQTCFPLIIIITIIIDTVLSR